MAYDFNDTWSTFHLWIQRYLVDISLMNSTILGRHFSFESRDSWATFSLYNSRRHFNCRRNMSYTILGRYLKRLLSDIKHRFISRRLLHTEPNVIDTWSVVESCCVGYARPVCRPCGIAVFTGRARLTGLSRPLSRAPRAYTRPSRRDGDCSLEGTISTINVPNMATLTLVDSTAQTKLVVCVLLECVSLLTVIVIRKPLF